MDKLKLEARLKQLETQYLQEQDTKKQLEKQLDEYIKQHIQTQGRVLEVQEMIQQLNRKEEIKEEPKVVKGK